MYALQFDHVIVSPSGAITSIVGPFPTIEAATAWHAAHFPDAAAAITAILAPWAP